MSGIILVAVFVKSFTYGIVLGSLSSMLYAITGNYFLAFPTFCKTVGCMGIISLVTPFIFSLPFLRKEQTMGRRDGIYFAQLLLVAASFGVYSSLFLGRITTSFIINILNKIAACGIFENM